VDTTTGDRRALLRWPRPPGALDFSPGGPTPAVARADGRLGLVEGGSGPERPAVGPRGEGGGVGGASRVCSPGGEHLGVGAVAGRVHLCHLATGKEVRRLEGHRGKVSCLAFSADGRRLASGSQDTTVLVWYLGRPNGGLPAAAPLSARELDGLWADLAGTDAA